MADGLPLVAHPGTDRSSQEGEMNNPAVWQSCLFQTEQNKQRSTTFPECAALLGSRPICAFTLHLSRSIRFCFSIVGEEPGRHAWQDTRVVDSCRPRLDHNNMIPNYSASLFQTRTATPSFSTFSTI